MRLHRVWTSLTRIAACMHCIEKKKMYEKKKKKKKKKEKEKEKVKEARSTACFVHSIFLVLFAQASPVHGGC